MRRIHIIVLLILFLFPMTGCIGDSDEETEGADDPTNSSTVNHYHNNTTIINHQYHNNSTTSENVLVSNETTNWFTSGGTFNSKWNMDGVTENGYFCIEWWSNGNCADEARIHSLWGENNLTVWDLNECTGQGGRTITDPFTHIAPICVIDFATINTTVGQAIMVHESNEISIESTCNGVSEYLNETNIESNLILSGSAMNCSHVLYKTLEYDSQNLNSDETQPQTPTPSIWSIVYEIKDVTVVN